MQIKQYVNSSLCFVVAFATIPRIRFINTNIVIFFICIKIYVHLYQLCFDNVTNLKNNNNLIRITDVEACLNYGVLCF